MRCLLAVALSLSAATAAAQDASHAVIALPDQLTQGPARPRSRPVERVVGGAADAFIGADLQQTSLPETPWRGPPGHFHSRMACFRQRACHE
jgi:hypothetical protein